MIWQTYTADLMASAELACVTSAHISLSKASHMTKSDPGWGILFLTLGDSTYQQWLRMQKSSYWEEDSKCLGPLDLPPSLQY